MRHATAPNKNNIYFYYATKNKSYVVIMPIKLNDSVFRAYDIRGVYPRDIDAKFAGQVARAYSAFIKGKRLAVSMDVRTSNEKLTKPFIEGLVESGAEVWFIGIAPTPLLYFTVAHYGLDGGAAVSASHNPPEWNGFKLCGKNSKVLGWGEGLEKIKEIMQRDEYVPAAQKGSKVDKSAKVRADYEKFVSDNVNGIKKLRIGIDPGNGAGSGFAAPILSRMNMDVVAINDEPDGRFPSRNPEPKPETLTDLKSLVLEKRLDFGAAFDGDADRVIFVDDKGEVLYGDKILALFANNLIKPGDKVVYDVSCSDAVTDVVDKKGGVPFITKVGHSAIEAKMLEENARIGGELSGHIYFRETYHFDDAFFATAWMAKLVSDSGKSLSKLISELPAYKSTVKEFEVDDGKKFGVIDKVRHSLSSKGVKTINVDGVKAITEDGWFIIRASNTTPKIKVVAEAKSEKRVLQLFSIAKSELDMAIASAK